MTITFLIPNHGKVGHIIERSRSFRGKRRTSTPVKTGIVNPASDLAATSLNNSLSKPPKEKKRVTYAPSIENEIIPAEQNEEEVECRRHINVVKLSVLLCQCCRRHCAFRLHAVSVEF